MGILQRLGLLPGRWTPPSADELAVPLLYGIANTVTDMPVEQLWEEQPHLRTVTDFIARSVSSTGIHAYRRVADGGRERVRDEPVARLCKKTSRTMLTSDLIYRSVMDLSLYDEFIWVLSESPENEVPEILPISPRWIQTTSWEDPWTMKSLTITDDQSGRPIEIPAHRVIRMHGYSPTSMKTGTTPVTALKDTLKEQLEAAAYRGQLWKNGPRLGGVITRPKEAVWDNKARNRFKQAWQAQYSGRGTGAGGTPVLEDGMELKPFHLKGKEEEFVDVAKLSLQTVASVYHINPTMVGLLDNANYSNVREFRKGLYGDSLGPIIKKIEDTLNEFVLPALADTLGDLDGVYLEFNLEEKLRASFEEKAAVTSTAVGGPWMTRNEARMMNNLPKLDGADDLIIPLNVSVEELEDEPEPPDKPDKPVPGDGGEEES